MTADADAQPFVPRVGTVRRLQALLYMGWGHKQMREHCGLQTATLVHQQGRWVERATHDAVAAMYRDLSHRRGPSTKAAHWAKRLGYAGPMDWHDIDHDAEPLPASAADDGGDGVDHVAVQRRLGGDKTVRLNHLETAEVVRLWMESGRPAADMERVTGVSARTASRHARRAGNEVA